MITGVLLRGGAARARLRQSKWILASGCNGYHMMHAVYAAHAEQRLQPAPQRCASRHGPHKNRDGPESPGRADPCVAAGSLPLPRGAPARRRAGPGPRLSGPSESSRPTHSSGPLATRKRPRLSESLHSQH